MAWMSYWVTGSRDSDQEDANNLEGETLGSG